MNPTNDLGSNYVKGIWEMCWVEGWAQSLRDCMMTKKQTTNPHSKKTMRSEEYGNQEMGHTQTTKEEEEYERTGRKRQWWWCKVYLLLWNQ